MKKQLYGVWSNGALNKYYGGSHDFTFAFRNDGKGCFTHDGWWLYSKHYFDWDVKEGKLITFNVQEVHNDFGQIELKEKTYSFSLKQSPGKRNTILRFYTKDWPEFYLKLSTKKKDILKEFELETKKEET